MAIHLAHFEYQNHVHWGVLSADGVIPLPESYATTGELVRAVKPAELARLTGTPIPRKLITLLSPVTRNQQFVCQGANYREHMIESGMDPDTKHFNMIFTKATSCIVAADSPVIRPAHVRFLDYEVELGLIMRREITGPVQVTEQNLHEFIAGIVVVNDYSARDIQIPQMQFYKGKSYRTFGPVGPWLCLLEAGDMKYLRQLQLTLKVDGQVRQSDSSGNMVHDPVATLNELASLQDLFPGDLIATGTPAGCALVIPSPAKQKIAALLPEAKKWALFLEAQEERTQYLQPGQVVEAGIRSADGVIDLGTQRNVVTISQSDDDRALIATTKKILVTGLRSGATESAVQSWLSSFGPVARVEIIREGNAASPCALVHMDIGDAAAAILVSRLSHYWHDGAMVNASLLHH
jgi:2,4-diketo-3-deoxy-L-fuconate hydrolase